MADDPRVSVIIVNWNGAEHLRDCLPSLTSQSFRALEIIIVDNNSSDESAEVATSYGARWLPLERNFGLAPGLNKGAAVAKGDLLLFVNNDMRFDPGFVAALVEPLDRDEEVFATDGMQFNWDGTICGHMACRLANEPHEKGPSTELVPGLYFYQNEEVEESPVFMASAACMMVRKSLFQVLGGFDDRLPLGYEDVEICWRAWTHRWKVLYVPSAICWHRVGSSARSLEGARFSFRGVLTGRLLLATKLLPPRYAIRTWIISTAGIAKDIGRLPWRSCADRIAILLHMLGLVRTLLRERKNLFECAGKSPKEQLDFMLQMTRT